MLNIFFQAASARLGFIKSCNALPCQLLLRIREKLLLMCLSSVLLITRLQSTNPRVGAASRVASRVANILLRFSKNFYAEKYIFKLKNFQVSGVSSGTWYLQVWYLLSLVQNTFEIGFGNFILSIQGQSFSISSHY